MEGFRHILVDGWNVIHSDTALKSLLENESQEAARSALLQKLAPLHDFGGVRVTVVYDGIGDDISIVRRDKILTLSEVFTPSDMTADELIEQLCSTSKNPGHLLVVSRDNLLRLTASSFGAMSITPEKALEWGGQSAKSISSAAASNNRKSAVEWRRQSPFSALDALAADLKSAMSPDSPLLSKKLKKRFKVKSAHGALPEKKAAPKNSATQVKKTLLGGRPATIKSLEDLKLKFSGAPQKPKRKPRNK